MKVSVIGPGAMGSLLAARFMDAGIQTTLVDRDEQRAAILHDQGIRLKTPDGVIAVKPEVATRAPAGQDLVVVCVKSYATESVALPSGTPILTLQSGLGNVETLCSAAGSAQVLAGVTEICALLEGPGQATQQHIGPTTFGAWTSCPTAAAQNAFQQAGLPVEITEAPGQVIWEHTAATAGIYPLTAILGVPNGDLLEQKEVRQLMRDLVVEAVKVASTEGYRFSQSLVEHTEDLCARTRDTISPMLQDVRAGRPTETAAISGEIAHRAQLAALPCPRTRVIWQLLSGLEPR